MRSFLKRLGLALCIAAGAICGVLHVTTFVTVIPPMWVIVPIAMMFGAILCAKAVQSESHLTMRVRSWELFGFVLLVYAIATFVYAYKTTGGASSVSIVNGQHVSRHQGGVIRTITEYEYRMFPNLWTRVMSAWIGMMAVFGALQFKSTDNARSRLSISETERRPRDLRTVFLHEIAIYEIIVPLSFRLTGVPPRSFFVFQGLGHILGAALANKFYWWYGRRSTLTVSRVLIIAVGFAWIGVGYLIAK